MVKSIDIRFEASAILPTGDRITRSAKISIVLQPGDDVKAIFEENYKILEEQVYNAIALAMQQGVA